MGAKRCAFRGSVSSIASLRISASVGLRNDRSTRYFSRLPFSALAAWGPVGYSGVMNVRRLTEGDAQVFWNLRLRALESVPEAFGESPEEHLASSVEALAGRLKSSDGANFVLGALAGAELVGVVGFYRDLRKKRRHRGWIWGMYVVPNVRGQGIGQRLLEETLQRARTISGLQYVLLSVSETQISAQRLYTRVGFRRYGLEPRALQVGERFLDEEHMVFTL